MANARSALSAALDRFPTHARHYDVLAGRQPPSFGLHPRDYIDTPGGDGGSKSRLRIARASSSASRGRSDGKNTAFASPISNPRASSTDARGGTQRRRTRTL